MGGRRKYWLRVACLAMALQVVSPIPAGVAQSTPDIPQALYGIVPDGARLMFRVRRLGLFDAVGRFAAVAGVLDARPSSGPMHGVLQVTIQTASIGTDSESLTGTLRGPDFFDVARYPEIRFVARGVTPVPGTGARISGRLTMRGVTRPATFDVASRKVTADGRFAIGFSAHGVIRRSDYGMTAYRPFVSDTVRLDLEAVLAQRPEPASGSRTPRQNGAPCSRQNEAPC
jgi:polyisoprenoid-binding protein YceI